MEKPVGKPYEGPSGIGRESTWLTNEDLVEGRDLEVTIKSVIHYPTVTFEGGRTRANVLGLQFVGKERVLLLNATNRKSLNRAFGNVTKGWREQKITLYVTDTQMKGETVKCVRIRDQRSRAATAAEELLHEDVEAASPDAADQMAFENAAHVAGLTSADRDDLVAENDGDFKRAHDELARRAGVGKPADTLL